MFWRRKKYMLTNEENTVDIPITGENGKTAVVRTDELELSKFCGNAAQSGYNERISMYASGK
jgi:hypothetical protein